MTREEQLLELYRSGRRIATPDEVEPWVILRCSRSSFYRAMSRGEVPGTLTLGRTRRLQLGTLLEWLNLLPEEGCSGRCHE